MKSISAIVHATLFMTVSCLGILVPTSNAQPTASNPVVSPEVQADHSVLFRLLAPNAKDVTIMGDFLERATPMTKDDQGVWNYKTGPLGTGAYGYYFSVERVRIPDPGNLLISSGANFLKSYVDVPGATPDFWEMRDVAHGTLHEHLYKSMSLNKTRRVIVYTPPGYNRSQVVPTIYLYHSSGDNETFWTRVGRAHHIMDNLIAEGKAKPALVVTAYGHSSLPPGPEGGTDGVELYEVSVIENDLFSHVIPLIEKEYSVGKQGKDRAIAGTTMGGYQSMTIALNNPTKIGYVSGFSAGFRANQDLDSNFKRLLSDVKTANDSMKLVWIRIGSEEPGGIAPNRRVHDFLDSKGVKNEFDIVQGGVHTWVSWRGFFRDFASRVFKD